MTTPSAKPTYRLPDPTYRLVFGYRHVSGVPRCPCADPGNYLSMEQSVTDPMDVRFTCWCGRTVKGRMESQEELDSFLKQGVDQ